MNAFRFFACFLGIAIALVVTVEVHASDIPGPPSAPCSLKHRMNVHFEDGWMYSCDCEVLAHGFHCGWNLVGKVESVAVRRFLKAHRSLTIPVLYIKRVVPA